MIMEKINKISNIKKEELKNKYLDRYVSEHVKGNWSRYRNKLQEEQRFEIKEKLIKFIGFKKVYFPIEGEFNLNLQESRGIGISKDTTIDSIIEDSISGIKNLNEGDTVRSNELDAFINTHFKKTDDKSFLEIGFRIPKVQYHYKNSFGMDASGVDINSFNVDLFSEMGFDYSLLDLTVNKSISETIGKRFDVISCYHVLEHVTDPVAAVENIFNSMNSKGIFHIEIPIEPGEPRLEYGHLISYEQADMLKILQGVGFSVVSATNKTHTNGPWIERYIAIKP